jgi:ornithine--oxo-acid transaminase
MERGVRHGSTFGGNDLAAAAALATLRVIEREGARRARRALGAAARADAPLVERYEIVRDVRGLGLMWAIELGAPEAAGATAAVWNTVERNQPGLAAQLITVPLFKRHRLRSSARSPGTG